MSPERQKEIVHYVSEQLASQPRWVRMWSVVSLVLSLGVLGLLAAVTLSGSATLEDIGLPLGFGVGFALLSVGGILYALDALTSIGKHPLVLALQVDAPPITGVYHTTIYRRGQWPALSFVLNEGGEFWIIMDDELRMELMAWLGQTSPPAR